MQDGLMKINKLATRNMSFLLNKKMKSKIYKKKVKINQGEGGFYFIILFFSFLYIFE